MDNGEFQAVCYGKAVYYDDGGVLKEIDNRLSTKIDEDTEDGTEEVYENTENSFKVKISKNLKSKRLVKIIKDQYKLAWGIKDAEINNVEISADKLNGSVPE